MVQAQIWLSVIFEKQVSLQHKVGEEKHLSKKVWNPVICQLSSLASIFMTAWLFLVPVFLLMLIYVRVLNLTVSYYI